MTNDTIFVINAAGGARGSFLASMIVYMVRDDHYPMLFLDFNSHANIYNYYLYLMNAYKNGETDELWPHVITDYKQLKNSGVISCLTQGILSDDGIRADTLLTVFKTVEYVCVIVANELELLDAEINHFYKNPDISNAPEAISAYKTLFHQKLINTVLDLKDETSMASLPIEEAVLVCKEVISVMEKQFVLDQLDETDAYIRTLPEDMNVRYHKIKYSDIIDHPEIVKKQLEQITGTTMSPDAESQYMAYLANQQRYVTEKRIGVK